MILLKAAILFVLANPAEFYPLDPATMMLCGTCFGKYFDLSLVPTYPTDIQWIDLQHQNTDYPCGQANRYSERDLKNKNITETKNTKVIGGSDADPNEFPWQVGLAFGFGSEITCGGSIISSKQILTAAHCVQDGIYNDASGTVWENGEFSYITAEPFPIKKCIYAIVGDHDVSKARKNEKWNRICNVEKHKDYKGKFNEKVGYKLVAREHNDNDFAVLTLCTELMFTDEVAPVCLPRKTHKGKYDDYVNKAVITSGWGSLGPGQPDPTILQKVELKTLSNPDCFGPKQYNWPSSHAHVSKICADGPLDEADVCTGDTGGPLVISDEDQNNENYYTLIGVTSYGEGDASKGWLQYPIVFARVTEIMDWLNKEQNPVITGFRGKHPDDSKEGSLSACSSSRLRKNTKNLRSLKNTGGTIFYHFEKDKKLSRKNAEKTCKSEYGGQLTSINTQDEYEWIKEQVKDLKMFGQIAIGGQWKDKSSRKFEWTDESEMDMSVLNANWFRTRNYQFPSYKNKKRINLELWYSRRALGFANALDHKAPTMYICKVAESCTSCSSCA